MVAPYPYVAVSGRNELVVQARRLFADYAWIARWSDEIVNDSDIDLKKVKQLAHNHCKRFRQTVDLFVPISDHPDFVRAVRAMFSWEGVEWADLDSMRSDLGAIYTEAGNFLTWVAVNMPEVETGWARIRWDEALERDVEDAIKLSKPHSVEAEAQKLRNLYGAVPL